MTEQQDKQLQEQLEVLIAKTHDLLHLRRNCLHGLALGISVRLDVDPNIVRCVKAIGALVGFSSAIDV